MDRDTERLAKAFGTELASVRREVTQIRRALRAGQLGRSSVDEGSLEFRDADQVMRALVGRQADGTYATVYADGPQPPKPVPPVVVSHELALAVAWDGGFVGGVAPADLDRVDVHISEDESAFTPTAATRFASVPRTGGVVAVPSDLSIRFVRLVAVSTSRAASAPSDVVTAQAAPASTIAAGAVTSLILASEIVLASKLVAGTPGGTRIEVDAQGIRRYVAGIAEPVMALLADPSSNDYYQVVSTETGETLANVAADGKGAFQAVSAGSMELAGDNLGSLLAAQAAQLDTLGSGLGGMRLIRDFEFTSEQPSVTFTNLPQTYDHLKVTVNGTKTNDPGTLFRAAQLRFNGDAGSNYTWIQNRTFRDGSTQNGGVGAGGNGLLAMSVGTTSGVAEAMVLGYAVTGRPKAVRGQSFMRSGSAIASSATEAGGGEWSDSSAVTSIQVGVTNGDFTPGSRIQVYSVGGGGAPGAKFVTTYPARWTRSFTPNLFPNAGVDTLAGLHGQRGDIELGEGFFRSGPTCLQYDSNGGTGAHYVFTDDIAVVAGGTYEARAWVRNPDSVDVAFTEATVQIHYRDSGAAQTGQFVSTPVTLQRGVFTEAVVSGTAPAGSVVAEVWVFFGSQSGPARAFCDDLSLARTDVDATRVRGVDFETIHQGYGADGWLNEKAMIGFSETQIQADLTGATITKIEAFLYFESWTLGSGGIAVLGTHNNPSPPTGWVNVNPDRIRSAGWPNPGGRWVELPLAIGAEFAAGTARGVTIGPGPTIDLTFAGRARGDNQQQEPLLRISYEK